MKRSPDKLGRIFEFEPSQQLQWHPIGTAPKDGQKIIVYRPDDSRDPISTDWWMPGDTWFRSRPAAQPTHWCELEDIRPEVRHETKSNR